MQIKERVLLARSSTLRLRRLFFMVSSRLVKLKQTFALVLTDAGCMCGMGMADDINTLMSKCDMPSSQERLTMIFSYSPAPQLMHALHEPVVVKAVVAGHPQIQVEKVESRTKRFALIPKLQEWPRQGVLRVLVWVRSRVQAQGLDEYLWSSNIPSGCLHIEMEQSDKNLTWRRFLQGQIQVLVTTDAGCQGLDIHGIDTLHYDLPSTVQIMSARVDRKRIGPTRVMVFVHGPDDNKEILSCLPGFSDPRHAPGTWMTKEGKAPESQESHGNDQSQPEWQNEWREWGQDWQHEQQWSDWQHHTAQRQDHTAQSREWQTREASWQSQQQGEWQSDQWNDWKGTWENSTPERQWENPSPERQWRKDWWQ